MIKDASIPFVIELGSFIIIFQGFILSRGHSKDFLFGVLGPTIVPILFIEGLLHFSPGSDVVPRETHEPA